MNTIGGTTTQFGYGGGNNNNNGTNIALAGGQTSSLTPRHTLGTEALLSMRGWLLKRKKGVFDPKNRKSFTAMMGGDFNKRFFWIDSSIRLIYYSESEDKSKRVSFIPFNRLVGVSTVSDPMAINTARPGWVYGLELRTTDRIYELWARTPGEAKQWREVMEKAASIGRGGMGGPIGSMTTFALGGGTTNFMDSVSPLNGVSSRRGSSQSGGSFVPGATINEQGNTIPVVSTVPMNVQGSGDDITVVADIKENLERTANAVDMVRSPPAKDAAAPAKWDDWDR